MAFLDKNGLQTLTNKLVQGDAIKVASHRGHTVKNVIDNITRECENISTPNTMNLENRVNEFKVGKGRDVDVSGDVEEGKIEVELQGKTWQNVVHGKKSVQSNIFTIEDGKYVFNNNATSSGGIIFSLICKPNTTYTLIINFLECALGDNTIYIDGHPVYLATTNKNLPKTKGTHAISFVTKDDVTDKKMKLAILSSSTSKLVIDENIIVLEGDHTQTPIEELPKYFEGIKSSFEDGVVDVEVIGKNLWNNDNIYEASYTSWMPRIDLDKAQKITGHQYIATNTLRGVATVVKVNPNTYYTVNIPSIKTDNRIAIGFYEEIEQVNSPNTHCIGHHPNISSNSYTFKTPQIECYMVIGLFGDYDPLQNGNVLIEGFRNMQVTQLKSVTPYEPFYKKKISFNIGEPLRSLPNGVCDEIRNNNGQWELVRRVGKVVLDGTTSYSEANSDSSLSNTMRFIFYPQILRKSGVENLYCDKFAVRNVYALDEEGVLGSAGGNAMYIRLLKSKLETQDVAGFKKWLKVNPTTIYYELETPIITLIEPIEFDVKPLATMTINSEIAPISTHKVILNRAGQIEQGIIQIAELKSRVDALETAYDSYLLETQHKLSILGFEYELESEEI